MALRSLSTILWRERQLVHGADGPIAAFALHEAELHRAVVVQSLVATLDLRDDVTLRELASRLPQPWTDVFCTHHQALAAAASDALPRSLVDFLR